ncbi:MAG: hypothetical protein RIB84_07310 [Sneathiellaceae bacterium]
MLLAFLTIAVTTAMVLTLSWSNARDRGRFADCFPTLEIIAPD